MLARQLRPTALDDLGLKAALAGHVERARAPGRIEAELRGARATSPACRPTSSSSSTGSPRRRSRTPPGTRAPSTVRVRLRARPGDRVELDGRRRRVRLHLRPGRARARDRRHARAGAARRRRRRGGVAAERRNAGQPQGAAATSRYRDDAMEQAANGAAAMKVLIADDHGIVRSGLRMLLERQHGHRGDRRGRRRRRGARHGDPRAARPGDPRRQDAQADRAAGDARDPRPGARAWRC